VGNFEHLLERVDAKQLAAVIADSRDAAADAQAALGKASATPTPETGANEHAAHAEVSAPPLDDGEPLAQEPLAPGCSIDDFAKIDLRVARVLEAETIVEAKKLLKLTISLGGDERRTIFAGIKEAYTPEALRGRLVIVVANLAPRKMKFGTSEGMVIAAGPGAAEIYVLSPDSGAKPGQRVH
jgi:methionyl-tRNA synthetase